MSESLKDPVIQELMEEVVTLRRLVAFMFAERFSNEDLGSFLQGLRVSNSLERFLDDVKRYRSEPARD